jgi:hypothetical protein
MYTLGQTGSILELWFDNLAHLPWTFRLDVRHGNFCVDLLHAMSFNTAGSPIATGIQPLREASDAASAAAAGGHEGLHAFGEKSQDVPRRYHFKSACSPQDHNELLWRGISNN